MPVVSLDVAKARVGPQSEQETAKFAKLVIGGVTCGVDGVVECILTVAEDGDLLRGWYGQGEENRPQHAAELNGSAAADVVCVECGGVGGARVVHTVKGEALAVQSDGRKCPGGLVRLFGTVGSIHVDEPLCVVAGEPVRDQLVAGPGRAAELVRVEWCAVHLGPDAVGVVVKVWYLADVDGTEGGWWEVARQVKLCGVIGVKGDAFLWRRCRVRVVRGRCGRGVCLGGSGGGGGVAVA